MTNRSFPVDALASHEKGGVCPKIRLGKAKISHQRPAADETTDNDSI